MRRNPETWDLWNYYNKLKKFKTVYKGNEIFKNRFSQKISTPYIICEKISSNDRDDIDQKRKEYLEFIR